MDRILICDDEADIVSAISIYLRAEGWETVCASNGKEALTALEQDNISLILLDIMMPEMDGIRTLSRIREKSNVPVIFLTAKSEDSDKILGLNIGADDYISKPFNPAELVARVRSQLRRYNFLGSRADHPQIVRCGGLELDAEERTVTLDGASILLTPTEFSILRLLISSPGTVYSTKEIYQKVFRAEATDTGTDNNIAVHVRHLREKIEIDPANPRYLRVVWGRGYKIEAAESRPKSEERKPL